MAIQFDLCWIGPRKECVLSIFNRGTVYGRILIDGKKIYQKSYNLGTINAFKKIENIANFDRNIRYEFSMRANDKISGMNGNSEVLIYCHYGW